MEQQHHFRERKAQGVDAELPIFYNNDPQEAQCLKCGATFNKYISKCKSCDTKHWCQWDPILYKNPFAAASSGSSKFTKSLGRNFAVASVVFYAYMLINALIIDLSAGKFAQIYILGVVYFYATYEIWAFTQGKVTHANTSGYFNLDPDLENTTARVYFLAIDLTVLAILAYAIFSLSS